MHLQSMTLELRTQRAEGWIEAVVKSVSGVSSSVYVIRKKMYGIKLAIIKLLILTRFTRILRMVKVVFNKIDRYI